MEKKVIRSPSPVKKYEGKTRTRGMLLDHGGSFQQGLLPATNIREENVLKLIL
jgi:hypothetical protein